MDIRNSLDGLRTLLGGNAPISATPQPKSGSTTEAGGSFDSDRATLSSAGSEMSQAVSEEGVAHGQGCGGASALAAGTYNVPASAVASKLVDAMLSAGGR